MHVPSVTRRRHRAGPAPRFRPAGAAMVAIGLLVAGCGLVGGEPDPTDAVYRVEVIECGGNDTQRATAVAIGSDLLATVAHSFGNEKEILVRHRDGSRREAELIFVDDGRDIALLAVDGVVDPVLELDAPEPSGRVRIATYADAEGPEIKWGEITELVTATLDGEGRRAAVKLSADIDPGDSGAPVVDDRQRMVAMVFATARSESVGWAVSSVELIDLLAAVDANRPGAVPPAC